MGGSPRSDAQAHRASWRELGGARNRREPYVLLRCGTGPTIAATGISSDKGTPLKFSGMTKGGNISLPKRSNVKFDLQEKPSLIKTKCLSFRVAASRWGAFLCCLVFDGSKLVVKPVRGNKNAAISFVRDPIK